MLHAVRKKPMRIKSSPGDIVFDVIKIAVLALFVIIIVFPMLNVLSLSVSTASITRTLRSSRADGRLRRSNMC